ncbi:DUF4382 domain-containing protein [Natronolimnohabitans innermongolicus]|uniref:DUF4382 domain-containing protein n=1 Tax=Natronolimnohabitans innermongolicus JCM 12255 TaxID=1227499 RepID=L9XE52_9EURY|nr:hypothetical protein C493_04768 [Natronolimnohabitans innermongolicus JCM 12255]
MENRDRDDVGRRAVIAAGGAVGATLASGCTSGEPTDDEENGDGDTDTDLGESATSFDGGNFRLLVSDLPADIGDFDRLDVSFDSARVSDGGGDADAESDDNDSGEESEPTTEDDGDEPDENRESDDDSDDAGVERRRGFYWLDLDGATVDLTTVIGEKAVAVFDGDLSPGAYEKIELHVSDVEGIVDDGEAEVKVPSEKLQITHSFEVGGDEPVEFVFDINVVATGSGGYNLTPVISESGVAGEDVEVEEVDPGAGEEADDGDAGDDPADADGEVDDGADADGTDETDGEADDPNTGADVDGEALLKSSSLENCSHE